MFYSFVTFPTREALEETVGPVFYFHDLKSDLATLETILLRDTPRYLIGVAKARTSRIETTAINQFGRGKKKVLKGAPDSYPLYLPKEVTIPLSERPTYTFCNWTMFNISDFIKSHDLPTKLAFIHINPTDIDLLHPLTPLPTPSEQI